jgi:sugar/nucleoside kinase (ribokinase family)
MEDAVRNANRVAAAVVGTHGALLSDEHFSIIMENAGIE